MSSFFNKVIPIINNNIVKPFLKYMSTPIGKITAANSMIFLFWKAKGLSEDFLPHHFAFERANLVDSRLYTAITYAFSHLSTLHFALNMIALQVIGTPIQSRYGARYVWLLYIAGAVAGSFTMNYFMPYDTIPIPKVGADPCISAFFSFLAIQNPRFVLFTFIFPVRLWFLLAVAPCFLLVSDSTNKNLGGLAMGVGLGLLKRRVLM